ncbi:MAG: Ig-like domain-containing protein [Candidatus Cloacimonetes bacterium]|nr:Ig-like domain-containing protein [Candidatus Cloacimonadota bacterium]
MSFSKLLRTLLYLTVMLLVIVGCGSKRNPTGGPEDTEKPVILGSSPAEFGELSNGLLEISFSKNMDKSSLTNSIYIYPPVQSKKLSLDGSTLKLKINEPLQDNTNYFVTLTTRLKDTRGNALAKNQTLVFRKGELNKSRIAGTITYEESIDSGLPIDISLLSADSLLVLSDRVSGGAYAIDALNPQVHLLRAFIDKNQNGRYDFGLDPTFEGLTDGKPVSTLDINLAYADSSKPFIRIVAPVSTNEVQVVFEENLKSYKNVSIIGKTPVQIAHHLLEKSSVWLLCDALESGEYTLKVQEAIDLKGNVSQNLESKFKVSVKADTTAPKVTWTNPRNGASVNSLSPVLEVHFSEIIPASNVQAKLISGNDEIPLEQLTSTGRIQRFKPKKDLVNYRTYTLKILASTHDFAGNKLKQDYELQFLPLKRGN